MLTLALDLSGFQALRVRTIRTLGDGIRRGVHEGVVAGADYARTHHRHKRRTGRLTSMELYARLLRGDARGADGEIVNATPYAAFVEYGTRPHQIWPKEGHGFVGPTRPGQSRRGLTDIGTHRIALRWYVGGRPVFARFVNHPGTVAMPFMLPAAGYALERIGFWVERYTFAEAARLWN